MDTRLTALILAAGQGTRMRSARPKPLHVICGKAMVLYAVEAVAAAGLERVVVVVGPDGEPIAKRLQHDGPDVMLQFVEQQIARGSGDAVSVALSAIADDMEVDLDDDDVVVIPGDMPLVRPESIVDLVAHHRGTDAAVTILAVPARLDDGLGRVARGGRGQGITAVVDAAELAVEHAALTEAVTGIYCFRRNLLAPAARRLRPDNQQGAYRLGDTVEVLTSAGHHAEVLSIADPAEVMGVNDRAQLAAVEGELRRRTNQRWLDRGVTMIDPASTYLDTTVELAADVTLFPGVILQGSTVVGEGAEIGADCRLVDCAVGAGARLDKTVARDAEIGPGAEVGPFAVLDPGSFVAAGVRTGPFFHSTPTDG